MKLSQFALLSCLALSASNLSAGTITSTLTAPTPGVEDIAHLGNPTSDTLNINGTGATKTDFNDASTYVANDRTTQGQTFTISEAGTVNAIWVKHVGYTSTLTNGTFSGLTDGKSITVRINSVSGTALTVIASETATVATGNGIGGSGQNWGGSGMDGTNKWLRIALDTPVSLPSAGVYSFDLSSTDPWFELAGLEAGTYADGAAYTTATKLALDTTNAAAEANHGTGDRTFMIDMAAAEGTAPVIDSPPADFTGSVGDIVTLTAVVSGDPSPTVQWEYSEDGATNWTALSGETSTTLVLSPSYFLDNGFYRIVASNGHANGPVASEPAEVALVYPDPKISQQPVATVVQTGGNATLSVAATGLGSLSYQWYKGIDPIDGATSDTLVITNAQLSDAGEYSVDVSDDAGEADGQGSTFTVSNFVMLSVVEPWTPGLVSHEPFDIAAGYAVGELPGQNPSITGYSGAWTDVDFGDGEPAISAGSLVYGDPLYLGSSSDKVSVPTTASGSETAAGTSGRVFRLLEPQLVANDSIADVRYMSFLFQSGQETGATIFQTLSLKDSTDGENTRNFTLGLTTNGGQTGTEYSFGTDDTYTGTGVAADTAVHLFVVKFELSREAGSDNVTVWVDPQLGSGEPSGGVTVSGQDLSWDRMALSDYDNNSAAWDEIRWGGTFDDVTLNPNPSNDFAAWIGGYPGVGLMSGFADDADGDGIANALENFFGTDPSVSNAGIAEVARSGNTVTFQHPQNATPAGDVSAAYVWSTDLATFHADGASDGGVTVSFTANQDTPVAGTTSVTATISGTVPGKLFVAVKATQSAP